MYSLNEEFFEKQAIPVYVSGSLRTLGQFQGKQELLLHRRPQLLKALRELAIIQSTESSNRIEGITVAPDRLNNILKDNECPKDRPEAQLLGYRDVLAEIHTNFHAIDVNADTILWMHNKMLQYTDLPRGAWKSRENTIEEKLPNGQWITRFVPISAPQTPYYMKQLCEQFQRLWNDDAIDKLLLTLAFVFDFLCIHPFSDGNGRLSRLLTVLILHKMGIDIQRYISFEKLVEDTKESYYDVLHQCSEGWHTSTHRLVTWYEYHIALLISAYNTLQEKVSTTTEKGEKTAWILEAIDQMPNQFRIGDLVSIVPNVSRPLIRHVLEELRIKGVVKIIGLGRSAKWQKLQASSRNKALS